MKTFTFILLASALSFVSCKKKAADILKDNYTREASFKISGNFYNVSKPYLGIFDNSGTINNTLTLSADNGSKIEFHFNGSSNATYQLQSFSSAYYKTSAGKQYNSISGELIVNSYSKDDIYKMSGTFHFKAKAITSPYDTIEITDGIITNASNEL